MSGVNGSKHDIFTVFGYIYIVIIILGVMTNTVVILTVLLSKTLRARLANWFVVSLTTSGLLFSCFIIPSDAYTLTGHSMSNVTCKVITFGGWFLSGASVLSLAAMALNRYFVIIWTRKAGLASIQCVITMITLCYVVPAVLVLPGLIGTVAEAGFDLASSRCTLIGKTSKKFKMIMIMILAAGPIILIIYCYCHIFREVKKSRKRLVDINQTQKLQASKLRNEIKLAKTIGLIFLAYLVTYVPSILVNAVARVEPSHVGRQVALMLVYFGVWINPLVYGVQNKQFRDAFFNFWAGKFRHNVNVTDEHVTDEHVNTLPSNRITASTCI